MKNRKVPVSYNSSKLFIYSFFHIFLNNSEKLTSITLFLVACLESPLWLIGGFCPKFLARDGDLRKPFTAQ